MHPDDLGDAPEKPTTKPFKLTRRADPEFHMRGECPPPAGMIEAIVGEVIELGHKVTSAGPFTRVMVAAGTADERRMNVWLPLADARGLALGTRVRVLVEVLLTKQEVEP